MASEKDLKLARLECNFYKSCNVVWNQGIELRQIRNSLLEELRQLERKEYAELLHVIEDLQSVRDADKKELSHLKLELNRIKATITDEKRDHDRIEASGEIAVVRTSKTDVQDGEIEGREEARINEKDESLVPDPGGVRSEQVEGGNDSVIVISESPGNPETEDKAEDKADSGSQEDGKRVAEKSSHPQEKSVLPKSSRSKVMKSSSKSLATQRKGLKQGEEVIVKDVVETCNSKASVSGTVTVVKGDITNEVRNPSGVEVGGRANLEMDQRLTRTAKLKALVILHESEGKKVKKINEKSPNKKSTVSQKNKSSRRSDGLKAVVPDGKVSSSGSVSSSNNDDTYSSDNEMPLIVKIPREVVNIDSLLLKLSNRISLELNTPSSDPIKPKTTNQDLEPIPLKKKGVRFSKRQRGSNRAGRSTINEDVHGENEPEEKSNDAITFPQPKRKKIGPLAPQPPLSVTSTNNHGRLKKKVKPLKRSNSKNPPSTKRVHHSAINDVPLSENTVGDSSGGGVVTGGGGGEDSVHVSSANGHVAVFSDVNGVGSTSGLDGVDSTTTHSVYSVHIDACDLTDGDLNSEKNVSLQYTSTAVRKGKYQKKVKRATHKKVKEIPHKKVISKKPLPAKKAKIPSSPPSLPFYGGSRVVSNTDLIQSSDVGREKPSDEGDNTYLPSPKRRKIKPSLPAKDTHKEGSLPESLNPQKKVNQNAISQVSLGNEHHEVNIVTKPQSLAGASLPEPTEHERDYSPEIPFQNTSIVVDVPVPSIRKMKKRKSLESVLSTLLNKNGVVVSSEVESNDKRAQKSGTDSKKQKAAIKEDKSVGIIEGKGTRGKNGSAVGGTKDSADESRSAGVVKKGRTTGDVKKERSLKDKGISVGSTKKKDKATSGSDSESSKSLKGKSTKMGKSQVKTVLVRRKKSVVVGLQSRGKSDLSVVDDERHMERRGTIKMNTSSFIAPKLLTYRVH